MFFKLLYFFLVINLFLTCITSPIKEGNQRLGEDLLTFNKNLNANVLLKIDKDDVTYTVKFSTDSGEDKDNCINYIYSYNRTHPKEIKISFTIEKENEINKNKEEKLELTPIPVKSEDEVKLVKEMDEHLDDILENLQPIAYCNIKLNLLLYKNAEGLISGEISNTSDETNITRAKAQDALQKSLLIAHPNRLKKLAFNLYIYTLALALVQHESLKLKPN